MTRFLAVAWTLGILLACLIPGSQITPPSFLPFSIDKWVHLVMFVGFGALWTTVRPDRAWTVFWVGAAYGIAIEILQGLLPIGRSPDILDALADGVGLGLGIGLAVLLTRKVSSND